MGGLGQPYTSHRATSSERKATVVAELIASVSESCARMLVVERCPWTAAELVTYVARLLAEASIRSKCYRYARMAISFIERTHAMSGSLNLSNITCARLLTAVT